MLNKVCFVAAAGQYGMGCRRSRRQDPIPICPAAAIPPPPPPPPPGGAPAHPPRPQGGLPKLSRRGLFVPFARLRSPPRAPPGGLMCLSLLCALLFPIFGLIRTQ